MVCPPQWGPAAVFRVPFLCERLGLLPRAHVHVNSLPRMTLNKHEALIPQLAASQATETEEPLFSGLPCLMGWEHSITAGSSLSEAKAAAAGDFGQRCSVDPRCWVDRGY